MIFAAEFPIRFGDVDYVRVAYYPRFFHLFHRTFEDWFGEALGVPYVDVITSEGIGFPAVNVRTDFVAPLRFGDRVRVELEVSELGKKSLTCSYTVTKLSDGSVAARAKIKTVAIDNDTFKAVTIPDHWRERFERFMGDR
jgi:4-hydroxybenzoyl-CoA thioesterase